MLQSKSNWKFLKPEEHTQLLEDEEVKLSPVIKELLIQRGIYSSEAVQKFLSPTLDDLMKPEQLAYMDIAKNRVMQAIQKHEKILVFGDYDADGVTSTTILMKALQEIGADCDYYIPNRFTEGYGPNEAAFRKAFADGFQLIITVDTGIASVHEANVAKELGLDLIITDHHEPQEELPDALAIIHPKCSPDYSFKELAGAGVAFKFAQALLGYFPEHLLDLVVIGTIADLVPLVGENRILAYYGLQKLSVTRREGLLALKKQCKLEGTVTEEDIGFLIGPRLNAVGRLQDADLAVQLLLSEEREEAEQLAEMVQQLNVERQQIVASIVKEVEELVEIDEDRGVIVVAKQGWNEGVLGIVASRLVRKYDRPAIVLAINDDNGTAKGSARSIPAFDLFQSCMKIKEVFTHFGGHSQAAGMTLPLENLRTLEDKLDHMIGQELTKEDFKQEILISKSLKLSDINETLIDEISQLAPFGMNNPKPKFNIAYKPNDVRQLGNLKKHLKLLFKDEQHSVEGIGFGMGELFSFISPQATVSVVGELSINEWNGIRKPQIVIEDMKIEHWQVFDHRGKKHNDITNYLNQFEKHIIVYDDDNTANLLPEHVRQVSYRDALTLEEEVDVIYLFDLPPDLEQLKDIIRKVKPVCIHACFYTENSAYMSSLPNRDDFKLLYSLIWKRKELDIKKELHAILNARGWTEDKVRFMLEVFSELEFVKIMDDIIHINQTPQKKDLAEAVIYQQRIKQIQIEKTLYYATYDELVKWFQEIMGQLDKPKEEVTHGL